jgi:hypothetical protein
VLRPGRRAGAIASVVGLIPGIDAAHAFRVRLQTGRARSGVVRSICGGHEQLSVFPWEHKPWVLFSVSTGSRLTFDTRILGRH